MSGAMTRGAQRVGLLEDLSSDVERLAVRWLRHWERDPGGAGCFARTAFAWS